MFNLNHYLTRYHARAVVRSRVECCLIAFRVRFLAFERGQVPGALARVCARGVGGVWRRAMIEGPRARHVVHVCL